MSLGRFLVGTVEIAVVLASLGYAATLVRARLLPGWSGAAARLAELILGLSALVVILELVGVVGLYRPGFVVAAALLVGLGAALAAHRIPALDGSSPPAPDPGTALKVVAALAALVVAWHWGVKTQVAGELGMYLPNTTWHNMPFAARFVQDAQVGALHFTDPLRLSVWFYPQNSELIHSGGILAFGSDFPSPLMNMVWLALALLAAWVIGRPYGVGAAALIAVAVVMDTTTLLLYDPGDAKNDAMGVFLFLAAVAILVNADAARRGSGDSSPADGWGRVGLGALIVFGLAAGLAAGTRLNLLAPVGILVVAVLVLAPRGGRARSFGVIAAGMVLTGGFWYLRNLITAGNPIPWVKSIGPIGLPHPDQLPIDVRTPGTVLGNAFESGVLSGAYRIGIETNLGDGWPLIVLALLASWVLVLATGQTRLLRVLGIVSIVGFLAYLVTPLTAAGIAPTFVGFTANMRYAAPSVALALALLPLVPLLAAEAWRRWACAGVLALLLAITAAPDLPLIGGLGAYNQVWSLGNRWPALLLALVVVAIPLALAWLWGVGRSRALALAASVVLLVPALLWLHGRSEVYAEGRYRTPPQPEGVSEGMVTAMRWASGIDGARIGIVGTEAGFKQYLLYGDDLSNRVQYVGERGPSGSLRPLTSCAALRRRVNELGLDYLVTSPYHSEALRLPEVVALDEDAWLRGDPALERVAGSKRVFVYRVEGRLDPAGCRSVGG